MLISWPSTSDSHTFMHTMQYPSNWWSWDLGIHPLWKGGGWGCLKTWLGSTRWGNLAVGTGAHVGSGAETVSTWTPADRCKEETDTETTQKQLAGVWEKMHVTCLLLVSLSAAGFKFQTSHWILIYSICKLKNIVNIWPYPPFSFHHG